MGDIVEFPGVRSDDKIYKDGWFRLMKFIRAEVSSMSSSKTKADRISEDTGKKVYGGPWVTIPLLIIEGVHLVLHFFR